jgi:hypothetical protein
LSERDAGEATHVEALGVRDIDDAAIVLHGLNAFVHDREANGPRTGLHKLRRADDVRAKHAAIWMQEASSHRAGAVDHVREQVAVVNCKRTTEARMNVSTSIEVLRANTARMHFNAAHSQATCVIEPHEPDAVVQVVKRIEELVRPGRFDQVGPSGPIANTKRAASQSPNPAPAPSKAEQNKRGETETIKQAASLWQARTTETEARLSSPVPFAGNAVGGQPARTPLRERR